MQNYSQIRVLGKGSFGSAWLVQRKTDRAQFVAKEIRLTGMKHSERESAKNEILTLKKLNHPNITRYVDHFEERGNLYIVMEYADGGDLYGKIKSRRGIRFSEAEVLSFFCQLCLALFHMHEKHILHRDLKSQNVFLTKDGVVKLGDFGISTVLKHTYELKKTVCGTPYYFSPELCQNRPYNNKSDIWALGCVLYEVTTLNHAFDGINMKALVQKILRGAYPPIHNSYSRDLAQVVSTMLASDPSRRPHIQSIVTSSYIRGALTKLQGKFSGQPQAVAGRAPNGGAVPQPAQQANNPNDVVAQIRAKREAEQEARKKQADDAKKRQAAHETDMKNRVDNMRKQMENEVKEHNDRLKRIKEQQAAQSAAAEDKLRERKAQEKEMQKKREEDKARQRNREKKWDGGLEVPAPAPEQQIKKPSAPYDNGAAAQAYHDMRKAALDNKRRVTEMELPVKPAEAGQRPAGTPVTATPVRVVVDDAKERREAFEQMQREAQANKRRLLGLDPNTPQPKPVAVPTEPLKTPPPRPTAVPVSKLSPKKGRENSTSPKKHQYHIVNGPAPTAGQPADKQVAAASDSPDGKKRAQDANAVDDDISKILGMDDARFMSSPPDDFADPEPEPGVFILEGQQLQLPVSSGDPLGHRIESLRVFLEENMGDLVFLTVYRMMNNMSADDDDSMMEKMLTELNSKHHKYVPLISQLIVCEDSFSARSN